jgi:hypothetical protein
MRMSGSIRGREARVAALSPEARQNGCRYGVIGFYAMLIIAPKQADT